MNYAELDNPIWHALNGLYESMGFVMRASLPMAKVERMNGVAERFGPKEKLS
jgi:hypothetical protein